MSLISKTCAQNDKTKYKKYIKIKNGPIYTQKGKRRASKKLCAYAYMQNTNYKIQTN